MTKVFHFEAEWDTYSCVGKDEDEARQNLDFLYVQSGHLTEEQARRAKVTCDNIDYGTWEEFVAKHRPIKTPITENACYDGYMFETFGEELAMVRQRANEQVFTIVETDGCSRVCPGFHFVDRSGYFLVEQPWKPEELDLSYII